MQAYKYADLYNQCVRQQASEAFHRNAIAPETYERILSAHPPKLYTPNYFIRIAFGLLTVIAVLFSMLLLWLITGASGEAGVIALLVICALFCYTALELFVRSKQYYNAGIDNILMLAVITCILSALLVNAFTGSHISTSICMLLLCLWLCIRFTDAFMAILSYCSLLALLYFICIKLGDWGKAIVPFVIMTASAVVYFVMKKLLHQQGLLLYRFCLKAVVFFTLLTLYAAGNYFVVASFSKLLSESSTIQPAWLFWIFTIIIPPLYLIWGILKKDMLFIRTGLGLLAATLFTLRYYGYPAWPGELEMLFIGVILVAKCYILIKYLRTPKLGFSFEKDTYHEKHLRNLEALIIAQTFGKKAGESKGFEFGGGSSGGGGATGNY